MTTPLPLRFDEGAEVDFADETLRALDGQHGDGVGDVFSSEHFSGVLRPAAREFRGDTAGADSADADSILA